MKIIKKTIPLIEEVQDPEELLKDLNVKKVDGELDLEDSTKVDIVADMATGAKDAGVAIDTTAAGDSFTAALAKSLLDGKSLEESIKFGHLVSSIVVTRKGAQTSIPSQAEINMFLQSRGEIQ